MELLTKKQAIEEHIKMWVWLSERPEASELDYFETNGIVDVPFEMNYLCEFVNQNEHKYTCKNCPIYGDKNYAFCAYNNFSLYDRWRGVDKLLQDDTLARERLNADKIKLLGDKKAYASAIVLTAEALLAKEKNQRGKNNGN